MPVDYPVDQSTVFDFVDLNFTFDGEGNSISANVYDGATRTGHVGYGGVLLNELDTSVSEVRRRVRAGTCDVRYTIQWTTGQPTLHTETLPDHLEFIGDLHLFHTEQEEQTIVGTRRVTTVLWTKHTSTAANPSPALPTAQREDDGYGDQDLGIWAEDRGDAPGDGNVWLAITTDSHDGSGWSQTEWETFPVEVPIQWTNDPNADTGSEEQDSQNFFRFRTGNGSWSAWIPKGGVLGDSLSWKRVAYGHLSFRRNEHAEWGVSPYVNLNNYKEMRFVAKRFSNWDTWDTAWTLYGEVVMSLEGIRLDVPPDDNASRYEIEGSTLYCHFSETVAHVVQSIRSTHGGTPSDDVRFQMTPYRASINSADRRLAGFFVQDLEDSEWSMMRIEISVR